MKHGVFIQLFVMIVSLSAIQVQSIKVNLNNRVKYSKDNPHQSLSETSIHQKSSWSLPETFNWVGCKVFNSCLEPDDRRPRKIETKNEAPQRPTDQEIEAEVRKQVMENPELNNNTDIE